MKAGGRSLRVAIDTFRSPAFVYLPVITVNKEAPEHSFAYFAANDGKKWLPFNVAGLQGATGQVCHSWHLQSPAKPLSKLSCQQILPCPIFQGGLPAHSSLTPWGASSLAVERKTTLTTQPKESLWKTRPSGIETVCECGKNRVLLSSGLGLRRQLPGAPTKYR